MFGGSNFNDFFCVVEMVICLNLFVYGEFILLIFLVIRSIICLRLDSSDIEWGSLKRWWGDVWEGGGFYKVY